MQGRLHGRGNDNSHQVTAVGISFYISDFMDFLKEWYNYLHFTDHKTEHQKGTVICLGLSSSSVIKLGFELGQLEPFLYATLPSLGLDLKDGYNLVVS